MSNLYIQVVEELVVVCQKSYNIFFSNYKIRNDNSNQTAPITYRSTKEIILNCNPECASHIAFQLSHELCHASIPGDVPCNLRWLEETFAVLASQYFPYKLFSVKRSKYKSFFDRSYLKLKPKCEINPGALSGETIAFLESGSGTSNYNDYGSYLEIGKRILPLVEEYPHFWKCVPYLYKISPGLPLEKSFTEWKNSVPSNISHLITVIESALSCW
jgi:hypothetical protein